METIALYACLAVAVFAISLFAAWLVVQLCKFGSRFDQE